MKRLYVILAIFFATTVGAFDCRSIEKQEWKELSPGVHWTKYDLAFTPYIKEESKWSDAQSRSVTIRAFLVDLSRNLLRLHSSKERLDCAGTDRYVTQLLKDQNDNAIGAINASFFVMPSGGILGLALDHKTLWSGDLTSLNKLSAGIFTIQNNIIDLTPKKDFMATYGRRLSTADAKRFDFAIEAYPQLLKLGELLVDDTVLNSRRSRTSIGVTSEGKILLLTIDARGETTKTGMTLFEYAHLVKEAKCGVGQQTVLNLDGGGSSAFAIPKLGLSEQADKCRHLGNILTIHSF